ncbi:MAG: bacteriohemerythrin [Burkholderiales bacterium]
MIPWLERYEVGVAAIDGQHREMLGLVNRLLEGLGEGRGRDELVEVLRELVRATEHNVATEERLMREHGLSPAHHADAHTRLLEAIRRFDLRLDADGLAASATWLREWLIGHIEDDDRPLAEMLRARGVS